MSLKRFTTLLRQASLDKLGTSQDRVRDQSSFTLIELLIVIAIVAVLSVAVILTLNPAEILKQARDANRLADIETLHKALLVSQLDNLSLGAANTVYISIPALNSNCSDLGLPSLPAGLSYSCATSANYKKTDGTGWIPVNFSAAIAGSPIGSLPSDPSSATSTNLYYTYVASGTSWVVKSLAFESVKQTAIKPNGFTLNNSPSFTGPYLYPMHWVKVPGNSTFGTSDFWVMKYEAKCIDGSSNTPYATAGAAYDTGASTYSNSTVGYTCTGASRYIASSPAGLSVTRISHTDAASYCAGIGAHLLTNDEWMTIATNAANTPSNWSGGSVGSGFMPRGNSNAGAAQYDGTTIYGAGYSDFAHLRTYDLSNGSVVWDIAGNVWEHVQRSTQNSGDSTATMNLPSCSSGAGWQYCQYGSSTAPTITAWNDVTSTQVLPPDSSWNSSQNVGQLFTYAPGGNQATTVFLRGGSYGNGVSTGPFTLYLLWKATDTYYYTGFRCAR